IPVAARLQEAKDLIPVDLSDIPLESRHTTFMKWVKSHYSRLRNWLLRNQTSIQRVKLDDLMQKTAIGSLPLRPHAALALLNASRLLRLVALRLAVNPIHAALIQKAKGPSFSPLKLLVYVAQLTEKAASFPYWGHLPEMLDPTEPFLCST